jgi:alkyl hydroperoxide reductase subunit F
MYDLIIVGGGPAGMTAAVYAARKKMNALMIARDMGGQVLTTSWIENYMGYQYVEGIELMDKFEEQIKKFPIEQFTSEEVESVSAVPAGFRLVLKTGQAFESRSVIIATGKKPRRLGVPGEQRLTGLGVTYCAICDGPLFAGEKVAVIGGGNSALEAIDDMLKVAEHVYAVTEIGFTGDPVLVDRISGNPKLETFLSHQVSEIAGADRVQSLTIRSKAGGQPINLEVRGVFVEIGLVPNSQLVKGLARLNGNEEIEVNCNGETSVVGLYAAGDVASTPEKQIIIAAGEGAKAALQAHRYLQRLPARG